MEISKIKVPGRLDPIDIKDTVARQDIAEIVADLDNFAQAADLESLDEATAAALNDLNIKSSTTADKIPDATAIAVALNLLNKKIIFLQNALDNIKSQMNN